MQGPSPIACFLVSLLAAQTCHASETWPPTNVPTSQPVAVPSTATPTSVPSVYAGTPAPTADTCNSASVGANARPAEPFSQLGVDCPDGRAGKACAVITIAGLDTASGTDLVFARWLPTACWSAVPCGSLNASLLSVALFWFRGAETTESPPTAFPFVHLSLDLPVLPWVTDDRSLLVCDNGVWRPTLDVCVENGLLQTESPLVGISDAINSPICGRGWYAVAERLEPLGIRCRDGLYGDDCTETTKDQRSTPSFVLFVVYVVSMQVAAIVYLALWRSALGLPGYQKTPGAFSVSKVSEQPVSAEEIAYLSLSASLFLFHPTAPGNFLAAVAVVATTAWRVTFDRNIPVLHLLSVVASALSVTAVSLRIQDGSSVPHPGVLALSLVSVVISVVEHWRSHGRGSFSFLPQPKDDEPSVLLSMCLRKQLLAAAGVWAATVVVAHPTIAQRPG